MRSLLLGLVLVSAVASAQDPNLSSTLKRLAFAGQAQTAQRVAESQRDFFRRDDPRLLEALSWVGRAGVFAEDWGIAEQYASETYQAASKLAQAQGVDSSPQLATALGASIEALAKAYQAQGDRAGATQFLYDERETYRGTSIETRIQKNYLLISIEGKPMPPIAADRFLGQTEPVETDGKVTLFYFWAHWCSDCKAQKPALAELHRRYSDRGLAIIGPTHLFGYAAGGRPATPAEEIAYIEGPWQARYPLPDWMAKPLGQQNWANFGVSTTPTLVLVDRKGVVRLYHPGKMSLEELEKAIAPLL